ncbi:YoaK family protein [Fodinicola acaciae]|uniref:YoaK family protein n=1 Tax=Fodinicola acaciae TaxID=2681555 RepID=UPI0013D0FA0F|nr:YoaK family protein [Fodinicola acaciae]
MTHVPVRRVRDGQESLVIAGLLAIASGFLDALTYLDHGGVFANAMTGNIILAGVSAAATHWGDTVGHLLPVAAFVVGGLVGECLMLPAARRFVPWPSASTLGLEIVFLGIVAGLPRAFTSSWLALGISFVAAIQSTSFRRVGGQSYSTIVTTNNLRSFVGHAFAAIREPDSRNRRLTLWFGLVCLSFLAGAAIGALCTMWIGDRALWIAAGILLAAWILLVTDLLLARKKR